MMKKILLLLLLFSSVCGAQTVTIPANAYVNGGYLVYIPPGCQSGAAVTNTGTTAEFNLATCTIPANTLGANGALRVTVYYQFTDNADTKTLTVRYATSSGAVSGGLAVQCAPTTLAGAQVLVIIRNANATGSQVAFPILQTPYSITSTPSVTSSIDTTAATYVNINCADTTSASDTCGIYGYTVEVLP